MADKGHYSRFSGPVISSVFGCWGACQQPTASNISEVVPQKNRLRFIWRLGMGFQSRKETLAVAIQMWYDADVPLQVIYISHKQSFQIKLDVDDQSFSIQRQNCIKNIWLRTHGWCIHTSMKTPSFCLDMRFYSWETAKQYLLVMVTSVTSLFKPNLTSMRQQLRHPTVIGEPLRGVPPNIQMLQYAIFWKIIWTRISIWYIESNSILFKRHYYHLFPHLKLTGCQSYQQGRSG